MSGCTDGQAPLAPLVQGSDSNFYGTTAEGGADANVPAILGGTIFKITPQGALTTLYSFCSQSGCTDGQYPVAGLVQGIDGYFYGTTQWGGAYVSGPEGNAAQTGGTVFRITAGGELSTLYSFCAQSGCTDGEFPMAGLAEGRDGNFYGTTQGGGTYGTGTIFKLSLPAGAPIVTLSPTGLTFPPQYVGVASAPQTVTLTNTGNAAITITSLTVGGDFAQTNTCGTGVAAGVSCVISVTFTPSTAGPRDGGIYLIDNASSAQQVVSLEGTGQDFTAGAASGYSTSQTVTAGQTAAYNLAFTPLGASGTLALSCAGAPTGATCTVNPASLALSGTGTAKATVTVTTTAKTEGPPTGKGDHPAFSQRPLHYPWGAVLVGWLLIAILTAVASVAAVSQRPRSSGTCPARKPRGAEAGIPARAGWANHGAAVKTLALVLVLLVAAIWVACGGGGNSTSPPPPAPGVSLSASALTFSAQNMGSTSSAQAATLTNSGNAGLVITSIALGGANSADFSQSNTCGGGVAAGANCQISVKFSPTSTGARAGSVTITDDASGSPQSISLSGTGVPPATPSSTYTLTVSATLTSTSGTLTHTIPLSLTVN